MGKVMKRLLSSKDASEVRSLGPILRDFLIAFIVVDVLSWLGLLLIALIHPMVPKVLDFKPLIPRPNLHLVFLVLISIAYAGGKSNERLNRSKRSSSEEAPVIGPKPPIE